MIYIRINFVKDKHDHFITTSDGKVLFKPFTISNNYEGFVTLFQRIRFISNNLNKVKVKLKNIEHYNCNLLGFLLDKALTIFIINSLYTIFYRKSLSLRKTKTDKVDFHTIATMIMSDMNLESYSNTSYHNAELKPLIHYHFDKIKERTKPKNSVPKLICILFPKLKKSLLCFIWHSFMLFFPNFHV